MRRSVKPLAAAALLLALCLLLLPAPARATGPLEVSVWLPRQSFAAGETATTSFAIVGGTPPYSVQSVTWLIREQDGQAYEQQGTVGSSSASYTLFYGVSGFCQVRVKDAAGTEASGQTMEFTISGASFHPLQATLTLGAASVSYGQEVWADWRITSGVPPYMLDWAWHFIEPDGFTSAIEGSKVESVASGRLSCKPEVGPQGYLLLSLRDKAGHALTLSTERFDILGAPPPPEPVNCAPMVSPQRVALGQPVTASWAVTGGVAPYTVLGAWEEGGARTADQGLSASGSTSYTPGRLGQGRFLLSVRDARGRAYDFSSPSFTVYDPAQASPLQVTLRLSADSVAAGGSLLATAEVAGGLPPYTYSFEHGLQEAGKAEVSFDQPPGPSNLYLLTADYGYSGRVSVGVRDAADQQADAIQHFTITGSPTVADLGLTASLSQASVTAGGSLTVSASATGGTPPYTYAFDWLVLDGDQVSAVGSYEGPQGSHSQALRFGQQGAVSVCVVDALGRGKEIDPLPFTITGSVAAAPLSLLASLDDTSADPGQTLALSVTALGGLAPYQYSYQWVVDDLGQEYVLSQAGGDQPSYSQRVPFGQSGYALAVVTDSLGRQAAARAGFIVNTAAPLTPLAVHFSFQSATLPPGGTLRLLAEPSGGQPPYSYSLALFIDTPEGLALADLRTTESRETAWTISEGSGGLVLASLSDSLGRATPEQSLRFTVKAGILPGDADLDGRVTVDDAARVLDFILRDIAPASMENANADGLGAVDLQDLLTIIQMAVGGRAGAGRFSRARARWP